MRWFKSKNENGFVLIGMLFLMILIAVTAVALNRRAGLQAKLTAGQVRTVQARFDQEAAVENALWELTQDPCRRTDAAGEDYTYNGRTYNRKVLSSTVSGLTDAITISVTAPQGARSMRSSFRYHIYQPTKSATIDKQIYQVCRDSSNNIYFAVPDKHTIYRRNVSDQKIVAVAGNGTSGFSGDGGPATDAQLDKPYGVFVDTTRNIFIADTDNHCIRKVDTSGNISTVAGTCTQKGSTGDGGPATDAQLNTPQGVYVDTAENIYIADTENNRIRKFTEGGNITTIAGTGYAGYNGDDIAAVDARLKKPHGVNKGLEGNIYIADTDNNRIRKFVEDGKINTIAGTGYEGFAGDGDLAVEAKLNKPESLCVDAAGNIYVADTENSRIRKFVENGNINTIAGTGDQGYLGDGGPAVDAEIDRPAGVCLLSNGEVIISDTRNQCLRLVNLADNISSLFVPGGLGLDGAQGIVLDGNGNLYIANTNNNRILKLNALGAVITLAGTGTAGYSGDGGSATSAELTSPKGVALDDDGNLYIADTGNHCIRKISTAGNISTVAGIGTQSGFSGDGLPAANAKLNAPEGVVIENLGGSNVRIYIADTGNHCIRRVDSAGNIATVAGTGTQAGYTGDGGAATSAKLNAPQGVFEISGEFFVADTLNHCIRKVSTSGTITTVAGTGTAGFSGDGGAAAAARLSSPGGVFVDGAGNLFIADSGNHRVRVVSALDDIIRTLAGTGSHGFNGEDQPAVQAQLDQPSGIAMAAVRGGRSIYISDTANNRIRILSFRKVSEIY